MKKTLKKLLSLVLVLSTLATLLVTAIPANAYRLVNYKNTILIGDSRTVGMYNTLNSTSVKEVHERDTHAYWYAKNGTGGNWFKHTAVPAIESKISNGTNVVILSGINDCKENKTDNLQEYIRLVNQKAYTWKKKGAHVYFVSLNPVGKTGSGRNGSYKKNGITCVNKKQVESWNKTLKEGLSSDITYIDTYSAIIDSFQSKDGLHYTNETNKTIFQTIISAMTNDSDLALHRLGRKYYTMKGWKKQDYTGFIKSTSLGLIGWAYIKDGVAATDYTGLAKGCAKGVTGWFYVKKGLIDYGYTGLVKKGNTRYYVKKGYLDQSYSGTVKLNGKSYKIVNGKYKG